MCSGSTEVTGKWKIESSGFFIPFQLFFPDAKLSSPSSSSSTSSKPPLLSPKPNPEVVKRFSFNKKAEQQQQQQKQSSSSETDGERLLVDEAALFRSLEPTEVRGVDEAFDRLTSEVDLVVGDADAAAERKAATGPASLTDQVRADLLVPYSILTQFWLDFDSNSTQFRLKFDPILTQIRPNFDSILGVRGERVHRVVVRRQQRDPLRRRRRLKHRDSSSSSQ